MIEHNSPKQKRQKMSLRRIVVLIGGVVFIVLVALITVLVMRSQPAQQVDSSKYQVVYMVTGQAYFGKLQNTTGDFLVMKSPYVAQNVASSDSKTDTSTQTTLLKVTDQVYGPDDSIAIKSSQVAFWQNLRDDSKVTKAIKSKE